MVPDGPEICSSLCPGSHSGWTLQCQWNRSLLGLHQKYFITLEHHFILFNKIFHHRKTNGFLVNPLNWKLIIQGTDWLGYWFTPVSLKPWHKESDDILHMKHPRISCRSVDSRCLGAVNHFCQMLPKWIIILEPMSSESLNLLLEGEKRWMKASSKQKN